MTEYYAQRRRLRRGSLNTLHFKLYTMIKHLSARTADSQKPLLTRRGIFHIRPEFSRSGEIGKRSGLKIRRAQALVGSIPTSGTKIKAGIGCPQHDPFSFKRASDQGRSSIFCSCAGSIIKTAWHPDRFKIS
jgi:hypothetical protein